MRRTRQVPPGFCPRRGRVGGREKRQAPRGTCSPCPGGEDHLKRRRRVRRIVPSPPGPPSPWLPALLVGNRFLSVLRRTMGSAPGDARGGAPCIRKLKISPFPPGRGAGGWGQKSKLKAGLAGDQKGKPPQQIPERQRQPATCRASPPTGTCLASSVSAAGGLMQGCRRRSPPLPPSPIKTARNPRPQSGRGRSRPARSGSSGNADYISIPMFLFSASSSEQRQQRQRSAEPQRHLRR